MFKIIDFLSSALGSFLYLVLTDRRKVALYNLSIILPEISEKEKKKSLKKAL